MAINPEGLARAVVLRAASKAGQRIPETDRQWTVDETYKLLKGLMDLASTAPNQAAVAAAIARIDQMCDHLIMLASIGYTPTPLREALKDYKGLGP